MWWAVIALLLPGASCARHDPLKPEQVHIAFGNKTNDIVVTWSTFSKADSQVKYGEKELNSTATGDSFWFQDRNRFMAGEWIHNVLLPDLKFDTHYVYKVGSEGGWHGNFSFRTPPQGQDWVMNIGLYGDLGTTRGEDTIKYLKKDVEKHMYNMILHVGDFAYDFEDGNGTVGDLFMKQIEPIAANVPYMTCPGNHEQKYNFTHYRHRFTMPGRRDQSAVFYSFDLGPVHFVSISTEVYYFYEGDRKVVNQNQYKWLEKDLVEATKKENRKIRPWIIIYGHRPMYCSNSGDDCPDRKVPLRMQLEKLLMHFGVDIVVWAHEHTYERLWPLYDYRVYNSSTKDPYFNPKAPIHIITGSAGCPEGNDDFGPKPEWSAFRSRDRGYTRFTVHNHTHIYMEQVSSENGEVVIDKAWIVQENHGSFVISEGDHS